MNTSIVLTGLSGSGKSSVGEALSQVLGWSFIDTDLIIEADYGAPVTEIFAVRGEPFFRDLETAVLEKLAAESAAGHASRIISTGGGAIISEHNRRLLKSLGKVIYLTAPVKVLAARLSGDTCRPLLNVSGGTNDKQINNSILANESDRLTTKLESMLEARKGAYMEADITVDTEKLPANDIARQICQSLDLQILRL